MRWLRRRPRLDDWQLEGEQRLSSAEAASTSLNVYSADVDVIQCQLPMELLEQPQLGRVYPVRVVAIERRVIET